MYKEDLTDIYIHLKDVLMTVGKTPIEDEFFADGLIKDVNALEKILGENAIDEQGRSILLKINQVAESITKILNLRYNLKTRIGTTPEKEMSLTNNDSDKDDDVDLINIDAACMDPVLMHQGQALDNSFDKKNRKIKVIPKTKTHIADNKLNKRLPKEVTDVLNAWYDENADSPYLSKDDIKFLKEKTSLQESQIKNWVSNKRRKNKSTFISPKVSQILSCNSD